MSFTQKEIRGMTPMFANLIIKMQPTEVKVGSIILPDDVKDKEDFGSDIATIVAIGEHAFKVIGADTKIKPDIGSKILIQRYAGPTQEVDDDIYRIIKDTEVLGIIDHG